MKIKYLFLFLMLMLMQVASVKAAALVDYHTSFVNNQFLIVYTLEANDQANTLPVFSVKFTGEIEGKKPFDLKKLDGAGKSGIVIGAGTYTNFWNIAKDKPKYDPSSIKIYVEADDVTKEAQYLCLNLKKYTISYQKNAPDLTKNQCRTQELWLKRIEPGAFMMGSPTNEMGRINDETLHMVNLSSAYYLSIFEVTQKQYRSIVGPCKIKSHFKGATRPMDNVSYSSLRGKEKGLGWPQNAEIDDESVLGYKKKWYVDEDGDLDCEEIPIFGATFFGALRSKTGKQLIFDLPTEAQWEYACRAGSRKALNNDTDPSDVRDDNLEQLAWYKDNSFDKRISAKATHPVGTKKPNNWGFYDMHGNVAEWCLDLYGAYGENEVTDPSGALSGFSRVLRGGNCYFNAFNCRSAFRMSLDCESAIEKGGGGFRVALGIPTINTEEGGGDKEEEGVKQTFDYYLKSSESFPVFNVTFYGLSKDGQEYLLEDIGMLSGDGATGIAFGNGEHQVVWQPFDDYTNLVDNLELKIVSKDVTKEAVYLILDLESFKMQASSNIPDNDKGKLNELWLKRIDPGTFTMGVAKNDIAILSTDTQRNVTFDKPFYMGIFEITKMQYELVTEIKSSYENEGAYPAESIPDQPFFKSLTKYTGEKLSFSLPTEEQWEYVCRAGTATSLNDGTDLTAIDACQNLNKLGWYWANSNGKSHIVGDKIPNEWGFYDMHGNVSEKCLNGNCRGGSWESEARFCRSSGIGSGAYGFRVTLNMDFFVK